MMILGLGTDLVEIARIASSIERFGARFLERIFTDAEQARANTHTVRRAAAYAKRFAAKEACAKALGTGFDHRVGWQDIAVANDAKGRPYLRISGGARAQLDEMTPEGMRAELHLTLSDERTMAVATVLIVAVRAAD